jgi:hypothetical protein
MQLLTLEYKTFYLSYDFISGQTAFSSVGRSEDIGGVVAFLWSPGCGWVIAQ